MSRKQDKKIEEFTADYRDAYDKPTEKADFIGANDEEKDIEIDDFLPYSDTNTGESLLTKWNDELEPDELDDVPPETPRPVKRRRHRYGVPVGALVLILALVGVGFIATSIGKQIYLSATDDSRQREYDTFLSTVVMQDPQPFASPDKANAEFVLNASIWKTITANNGMNYTDYDDTGRVLVPLGDVVDSCRSLFGPDCQLQPKTPEQETFYEYNSSENQFHVALYSSESSFVPYTENAKKQGDSTVLRVGYVSPSDTWRTQTTSTVTSPTPTKYMEYVLKTDAATNTQYIYAINEIKEK